MIDIIGTHPNLTRSGLGKAQGPLTLAYVRVSTEKQELSPKAQVQAIQTYAHFNGLTIHRYYVERKSAKSLRGRPELQRILDMADAGMVANVVVQDITRLFRSVREALIEFDRLESKGVRFHSAVEPLDASTPDGELMRTFKLALGQHERRRLGERTARVCGQPSRQRREPAYRELNRRPGGVNCWWAGAPMGSSGIGKKKPWWNTLRNIPFSKRSFTATIKDNRFGEFSTG